MAATPGNRFASSFSSRQPSISELPNEFKLKESEANAGPCPSNAQTENAVMPMNDDTSLASLNLEANFAQNFISPFQERPSMNFGSAFLAPGNSMVSPSFRQGVNPRRHSLADPYSLQRFQAMRLGINPLALPTTGEEPPSGFEFNSNQGMGPLNTNGAFSTIKEEEEFPASANLNDSAALMEHANSSGSRMRSNNGFYSGNMTNGNESAMPESMAFLGNHGFGQLPPNDMYGNLNGLPFSVQSTSGETSQ
ncbi:hypothetical protein L0F63_006865, partial [Massospora cicadina]